MDENGKIKKMKWLLFGIWNEQSMIESVRVLKISSSGVSGINGR